MHEHILIADDDELCRELTVEVLRREGYICDEAETGDQVRVLLSSGSYDLLVSDIRMPGNPNLELVRAIAEGGKGPPIILMTGFPTLDSAIDSVRLPVAAYLRKPFETEELLAHVQRAIAGYKAHQALGRSERRLESWRSELESIGGAIATKPSDGGRMAVDAFRTLTLRNILESLEDLKNLSDGMATADSKDACHMFDCPRLSSLTKVVEEAVDVLERTKTSFKSKELGALRLRLEDTLRIHGKKQ